MLYIDTSVLLAALTAEAKSERMQDWLAAQPSGDLAISDWTITKFSSALSIKLRTGQFEVVHRNSALAAFNRIAAESLEILPVSAGHFRTAARLTDQYGLGLPAGVARWRCAPSCGRPTA